MAFDTNSQSFFGVGYRSTPSGTISFGTKDNDLPERRLLNGLTTPEATNDPRKVMYEVMDMFFRKLSALPVADRPEKFTISRASTLNEGTNTIARTYIVNVLLASNGTFDVAIESDGAIAQHEMLHAESHTNHEMSHVEEHADPSHVAGE